MISTGACMHDIYQRYPMMLPFEGRRPGKNGSPKLLLVGESHYLPDKSTQHLTTEGWYGGSSLSLTEKEQSHINPTSVIRKSMPGGFKDRAKSIFLNSFQVINDFGPQYEDYREVAEEVVFYNYFLRPAKEGKSLCVEETDIIIADEVFREVYHRYEPGAVVFLSRLANRKFRAKEIVTVPIVATPHPGCAYWNRATKKYRNKNGREILAEFIGQLQWRKVQ